MPPQEAEILLLMPQTQTKPFSKSRQFKETEKLLHTTFQEHPDRVHICFYAAPFGVIPPELDHVYPLSQHETICPLDQETVHYVAKQVADYIRNTSYQAVILLYDPENWNQNILNTARKTCKKRNITFKYVAVKERWNKTMLTRLKEVLHEILSDKT